MAHASSHVKNAATPRTAKMPAHKNWTVPSLNIDDDSLDPIMAKTPAVPNARIQTHPSATMYGFMPVKKPGSALTREFGSLVMAAA